MRTAILFAFAVGFSVAAPVPKSLKQKSDSELLEGRWEAVSINSGDGPQAARWWLEVRDGKLSAGSGLPPAYNRRSIRSDSSTSPKQFDLENTSGGFELGVYELDGDTFVWCESVSTTSRPTRLKAGDGCCVWVCRRVKKE